MIIQINTDKNIEGSERFSDYFSSVIDDELRRFDDKITRIEVHLSDENGNKEGTADKRCLIEARLEGRQPIAVSNTANTHEQAVDGAIDKLKVSLETIIGRLKEY